MKETDFAYAAGLLDGDGSYIVEKRKQKNGGFAYAVSITLNQVDPTAPAWLKTKFGGTVRPYPVHATTLAYRKPNSNGATIFYRWSISGRENVTQLLTGVLPFVVGKTEQASIALEVRSILTNRNWKMRPQEITTKLEQLYQRSRQLKGKNRH